MFKFCSLCTTTLIAIETLIILKMRQNNAPVNIEIRVVNDKDFPGAPTDVDEFMQMLQFTAPMYFCNN